MNKKIRLILCLVLLIIIQLFISFTWGIRPIMLKATTYNSYVDYSEYLVANFDNYRPIINSNTPNLEYYLNIQGSFDYSFNSCYSGSKMADVRLVNLVMANGVTTIDSYADDAGELWCSQPYTTYYFDMSIPLRETVDLTNYILNIDNNHIFFGNYFRIKGTFPSYGSTLTISNFNMKQWFEIDFNNTYLMSTFLLESDWVNNSPFTSGMVNRPFVLYAETANDRYNVYNDNLSTTLNDRYKYAIDLPTSTVAYVVNKIGTGWESNISSSYNFTMRNDYDYIESNWRLYLLNASPMQTPFDDTVIDTAPNYAVCDTSLFGWPVDCTIDGVAVNSFQAMGNDIWEWLSKESPIFGDIWTLASAGFQWFGNMFQFLGDFDPLSLLGGMLTILMGVLLLGWAFKGG